MKFVRFGALGAEKPGVIDQSGQVRDISSIVPDITPQTIAGDLAGKLAGVDLSALPQAAAGTRLGAPISRMGHFIAIGLNFTDHAEEMDLPIPTEPIIFSKAPSSLSGPYDDVVMPRGSTKTDWEIELAIVIGKECHYVPKEQALDHVFGYTICNDVSERYFQAERGGQWVKAKSAKTFGPLGPWIATTDEIPDPQSLDMRLDVNGQPMQTGNSSTMIFGVAEIVSYLSEFMVLEPGDVVTTGTPPGVGMGRTPPRFLSDGDVMTLAIAGLGEQRQKVVAG